jgi:hypothetical protein
VVAFSDASTDDTGTIDSYQWFVDDEDAGSDATLSYVFDTAGSHRVSLTVTDDNYDEDTAVVDVSVAQAPSERARSGVVEARLYYTTSARNFQPVRLQVLRSGQLRFDRRIGPRCGGKCPINPVGAYGGSRSLHATDLNGDGEPEVEFDFAWGNICCRATTVLQLDAASGQYRAHTHNWGNSSSGPLLDLEHDGRPVWRSWDGRIRYAFGCGACVAYPVQVIAYRDGRFVDVTRSYPRVVRTQVRRMWRSYRRHPRADARGTLAVWAADQYNLGRRAVVWRVVNRALRAGRLRGRGEFDGWPQGSGYVRALRRWLHRCGYS